MKDPCGTHSELIEEISLLQQRIKELVYSESERRQAGEALRREHSFSRAIIDNIAEGLCVCHDAAEYPYIRFTVWNDRMTEITGYTMEEINRLGWYQSLYPDPELQAKAVERMKEMRRGESLHAEEWEITRADKTKRVLNISTSIVESNDGVVHVLALMQDFTERNRAERALHESEKRLREVLENSLDASYKFNFQTRTYDYMSPVFARMVGYAVTEVNTLSIESFWDSVHPDDRVGIADVLADSMSSPADMSYQLEYRFLHKDGQYRWFHDQFIVVRNTDGHPLAFIGSVSDITERKLVEEELARYRYQLERLVQERTAELMQVTKNLEQEIVERRLSEMELRKSKENLGAKSAALKDLNTALKVLLRQKDEEKEQTQDLFASNIRRLVIPYIDKLMKTNLDSRQVSYLGTVKANLEEIVAPLLQGMKQFNLAARETQIASLIRDGKTTKEIADVMAIATTTVDSCRNSIRKKLGLIKKKVNLSTYLRTLE